MKRKNWYPLDNAAKLYPAVSNARRPYQFFFSALMAEEVKKESLELAVNRILARVPTFRTRLKKGIFWYYLEENKLPFLVREEPADFLGYRDARENNDYLFSLYYRANKITLVCFHALSDGGGAMSVFQEILFEYLRIEGKEIDTEGLIKPAEAPLHYHEAEDNFVKYYVKTKRKEPKERRPAYADGTPFPYDGYGIITAKLSLSDLKAVAKGYGATLTEYFCGLYMYCFFKNFLENTRSKNKLVTVVAPLNLRTRYPSDTLRNFTLFVRMSHDFSEEIGLEDCIRLCSEQMKAGSERERLDSLMYSNVRIQKNPLMKIAPLFLKDIVIRMAYHFVGETLQSCNLSNVGLVTLPESVRPHVKDLFFGISPSYTCKEQLGAIGYGDHVNLTFTRMIVENSMEATFIGELTRAGIGTEVSSNYWEKNL